MPGNPIPTALHDAIAAHRALYLRTGGAQGHIILNAAAAGGLGFSTNLLIRYTGRKSGKSFVTPLSYGQLGGEVVIVASKGGADQNPIWYLNVRQSAAIEFQIATQAFRGSWREPVGAEREKVWNFMVECYAFYANYQAATSRIIPVVMMTPIEEIPVFTESVATV